MKKKKLSICIFGSYDERVLSTRVLLSGLTSFPWLHKISYVHEQIPSAVVYNPHHLGLLQIVRRAYWRIKAQVKLIFRFREVLPADVIVVLPFGLFDLVQAWFYKRIGKKVVYVPQNSLYDLFSYALGDDSWKKPMVQLIYHIERFLWKIPHVVVFNTSPEADVHKRLLDLPGLRTGVVPLGADDSVFKPQRKLGRKSKFNVLFYGEYNIAQGVLIIIRAASMLKRYKRIRFTMIGGGKMRDAALILSRKLRTTNITFINWVSPQVLTEYIRDTDVTLGMFKSDPVMKRVVPNKVYQGMASSRAVITAQGPAASAWLTHKKDVFFVSPDEPRALAKAIVSLMKNGRLRNKIAQGGYKTFKRRFSRKPVTEELILLIEKVAISGAVKKVTVAEQLRGALG